MAIGVSNYYIGRILSDIYAFAPPELSDPDLLPLTNEDPISSGISDSEVVEPLTSSPTTDDLGLASRPPSGGGGDCCNEKALVLYSSTNTLFFKPPTSPDFSVVVNSDLIPGLRDQFILLGNSNMVRPMKDALIAKDKITDISDDRLAVVPWVGTRAGPQVAPPPRILYPPELGHQAKLVRTGFCACFPIIVR
ncbi:hypothetical protein L484_019882 [Morus notabilis]|uniref:Uncharacterized protein n=1 Tax=Morus notabilis TaxID=981085 RepID=W9SKA3_9ROSA|nr:hypothetical protein L484_019882 [Morus notabilis]